MPTKTSELAKQLELLHVFPYHVLEALFFFVLKHVISIHKPCKPSFHLSTQHPSDHEISIHLAPTPLSVPVAPRLWPSRPRCGRRDSLRPTTWTGSPEVLGPRDWVEKVENTKGRDVVQFSNIPSFCGLNSIIGYITWIHSLVLTVLVWIHRILGHPNLVASPSTAITVWIWACRGLSGTAVTETGGFYKSATPWQFHIAML